MHWVQCVSSWVYLDRYNFGSRVALQGQYKQLHIVQYAWTSRYVLFMLQSRSSALQGSSVSSFVPAMPITCPEYRHWRGLPAAQCDEVMRKGPLKHGADSLTGRQEEKSCLKVNDLAGTISAAVYV